MASFRRWRDALRRAVELYRQPELWSQVMRTAMAQEFSWSAAATRYMELYARLIRRSGSAAPI